MLPSARWTCDPYDVTAAAALADALGLSPATAAILVRRGYGDPARARAFLAADERADPLELHGVPVAVELIRRHLEEGTRVAVFGDYDVDGVCSTAMMVRALRELGAEPLWRLPSRDEGYGLSDQAIAQLHERGRRPADHRRLRDHGQCRGRRCP